MTEVNVIKKDGEQAPDISNLAVPEEIWTAVDAMFNYARLQEYKLQEACQRAYNEGLARGLAMGITQGRAEIAKEEMAEEFKTNLFAELGIQ
jgi:hypothetical protein